MKVEGHPHLVRDMKSGAILNTDRAAYLQSNARKKLRAEKTEQERSDRERLDSLEKDISEIKEALNILVQNTYK